MDWEAILALRRIVTVEVQKLGEGLWRWTASHPDWEPGEGLPREVGSVYYEARDAVVLIDPLVPDDEEERFWTALDRDVDRLGRPVVALLSVPWHERSAARITERYGGSVSESAPDDVGAIHIAGVGGEPETIFWLAAPGALVFGDIIIGTPPRIEDAWLPEERRGEPIRNELRAVLDLPVELLLPSHGAPVVSGARAALDEALA